LEDQITILERGDEPQEQTGGAGAGSLEAAGQGQRRAARGPAPIFRLKRAAEALKFSAFHVQMRY